jgi:hypothetical protein
MKKTLRPIRIEGDVAYVPLTQGYDAIIDAEDVHLVGGFGWRASVRSHSVYAKTEVSINGERKTIYMHRVICPSSLQMEVDHINGNGVDNRKFNLRISTRKQNGRNIRPKSGKLKGTSFSKEKGKWVSQIKIDGKSIYLGRHDTEEEAHIAYVVASKLIHGEFGRSS